MFKRAFQNLGQQNIQKIDRLNQSPTRQQLVHSYTKYFDKNSRSYKLFKQQQQQQNNGQNWNFFKSSSGQTQQFALAFFAVPILIAMNNKFNKAVQFFGWGSKYQTNKIENRATSLQYSANNPIEDRLNVKQLETIEGYLLEVYDGHGGWQVSQFAQENFSKELERILKENKEKQFETEDDYIKESLVQAFDMVEESFLEMARKAYQSGFPDVSKVGSCALVALVHNNKIYSANIGDCKGVIVSQQENGNFESRKINHKLNANSKKEQARLKQAFKDEDDIVVCKRGSDSCYVKARLQPTRAFGDFQLKYPEFNNPRNEPYTKGFGRKIPNFTGPYITHKPELQVFELNEKDQYLVMATDGLWDELNKKQVADIVRDNKEDKTKIIQNLYQSSIENAAQMADKTVYEMQEIPLGVRRRYHDDISIVVVDLENQFSRK